MKTLRNLGICTLMLSAFMLGCGGDNAAHNHDHDDHSHDEHAHDDHDDHDHDDDHSGHSHDPMHGGTLIEFGDHVGHAETVIDEESGTVTVYLLDGGAEGPVRVTQETLSMIITPEGGETIEIELAAVENVLTSETVGDTSQFQGIDEGLIGVQHADVTIGPLDFRGLEIDAIEFHYGDEESH